MSNSYKFYSDTKDIMKKYVNATEGAIIYGISKSRIMVLASEAGAVYKVGNSALINTDMRSINEQCVRQLNGEVDETEIQNIMRYGRSDIDDEYLAIIKAEIEDFVEKVYNSIREFGYNLKTTPIVFVGGGAVVMKNFSNHEAKNISYILDVKANARGYEQLAIMGLKTAKRLA